MIEQKIFCDICGKVGATRYPSFFEIIRDGISVRGCLRYDLSVDLCREDFQAVEDAIGKAVVTLKTRLPATEMQPTQLSDNSEQLLND